MLNEYMVKQYVGQIEGKHGLFNVYTTGDPKYYLFKPVMPNGCEGTLDFPIKKTDLKDEIRHALRHGCSLRK